MVLITSAKFLLIIVENFIGKTLFDFSFQQVFKPGKIKKKEYSIRSIHFLYCNLHNSQYFFFPIN